MPQLLAADVMILFADIQDPMVSRARRTMRLRSGRRRARSRGSPKRSLSHALHPSSCSGRTRPSQSSRSGTCSPTSPSSRATGPPCSRMPQAEKPSSARAARPWRSPGHEGSAAGGRITAARRSASRHNGSGTRLRSGGLSPAICRPPLREKCKLLTSTPIASDIDIDCDKSRTRLASDYVDPADINFEN